MLLAELLVVASGLTSTMYGIGESNCGDVGHAVPCDSSATTASGLPFDPTQPMAAIAAPEDFVLDARDIFIKTATSKCIRVLLADKMNERYIGERGFDLTPEVVRRLTGKEPTEYWSDQIFTCKPYNELWEPPVDFSRQP